MTSVGLGRALAVGSGSLRIWGIRWRNHKEGRQGKSAASGRAHMVGRLEFQGPSTRRASWRFEPKAHRYQCPDRRRCRPESPSRL